MFIFFLTFLFFLFDKILNADEIHFADSHGPITVMGDHMHKKKELMLSLKREHYFNLEEFKRNLKK